MAALSDRMEVKSLKSNSNQIWLIPNSSLETVLLAANLNDRVFLTMVLGPLDNFACILYLFHVREHFACFVLLMVGEILH